MTRSEKTLKYLQVFLLCSSNILTNYIIYPIVFDFIYKNYYLTTFHFISVEFGFLLGLIFFSYELTRLLGNYIWARISDIFGFSLSISISLAFTAFFNFSLSFVNSFELVLIIRSLAGFFNNLGNLTKFYIMELFSSQHHSTVLNYFIFFTNSSTSIAFFLGCITHLIDTKSIQEYTDKANYYKQSNSPWEIKMNNYYIQFFLLATINAVAFILNFFVMKPRIIKRRTLDLRQTDSTIPNVNLNFEHESIPVESKENVPTVSLNKKIISNAAEETFSDIQIDKLSKIEESNKIKSSVNHFYSGSIQNLNKLAGEKSESIDVSNQKDDTTFENKGLEETSKYIKEKNEKLLQGIHMLGPNTTKSIKYNILSDEKEEGEVEMKSNILGKNAKEPHIVKTNSDNLSKDSIGLGKRVLFTSRTGEKLKDDISALENNMGIKKTDSDVTLAQTSTSNAFPVLKVSLIFGLLQGLDNISFFLFLLFTFSPSEYGGIDLTTPFLSLNLGIVYLIYTIVHILIIKFLSEKLAKLWESSFLRFLFLGLCCFFSLIFPTMTLFQASKITNVLVTDILFLLRLISFSICLLGMNFLISKISNFEAKKQIQELQTYASNLIKCVLGILTCIVYWILVIDTSEARFMFIITIPTSSMYLVIGFFIRKNIYLFN